MNNRLTLRRVFSVVGVTLFVAMVHPVFADPVVSGSTSDGGLIWDSEVGKNYSVEWSSTPGGPYHSDWSMLQYFSATGETTTATIPLFFRVQEHGGLEHLPAALDDTDFYDDGAPLAAKVELGKTLFFDKILSGNLNISCATCHHSLTGTGDGLALPIGEGGRGLGVTRDTGSGDDAVHERVPRNAPPVFNLGARSMTVMFHDGRVAEDIAQSSGFISPAGNDLPPGLDNALAAQAMFPVTSGAEMAGQSGENAIADFAAAGNLPGIWEALADRLRSIPEYVEMFAAAYPGGISSPEDVTYVQAANAIAAFESVNWRADQSPFDRFLRGEFDAMSAAAKAGMGLFYGKAACADCHSGALQTDLQFHTICVPQVGPGKGDGNDGHDDNGRFRETNDVDDLYAFRTPTLRNVALTSPYGHDGAFDTLEGMVRHHLNPVESLHNYDASQLVMPSRPDFDAVDLIAQSNPARRALIAAHNDLSPVSLTEAEISQLMDFLHALTDTRSIDLRLDVPRSVPSGLSLAE